MFLFVLIRTICNIIRGLGAKMLHELLPMGSTSWALSHKMTTQKWLAHKLQASSQHIAQEASTSMVLFIWAAGLWCERSDKLFVSQLFLISC